MTRTIATAIAVAAFFGVMTGQTLNAASLFVAPIPGGPGYANYFNDGNQTPDNWGRHFFGSFDAVVSGRGEEFLNTSVRPQPTVEGDVDGAAVTIPGEWGLSFTFEVTDFGGGSGNDTIAEVTSSAGDYIRFYTAVGGPAGDFVLASGPGPGYTTTVGMTLGINTVNTFLLRHDPTDDLADVYINGVPYLNLTPRDAGSGLEFNRVSLGGGGAGGGTAQFDNILAGAIGVVPEPGILALLGVSALMLRGARRRG